MKEMIKSYFPSFPDSVVDKLCGLFELYEEWNAKINVISRKDFSFENFCIRHVLHSLAVLKFKVPEEGSTVLDVGTGGGFPGIPLAVVLPSVSFTLLDSRNKKLIVVEDVAKRLGLTNVKVLWDRVENVKDKYDYVTGRAVKDISVFYGWTKKNLKKNGKIIYLAGGEPDTSFVKSLKYFESYDIGSVFKEEFFETKKVWIFA